MLVCPSCNAEYESGKFCKKCGTKLIDKSAGPTHCANCGAELEEGAMFCGECGTKVQSQPQSCTCPKCGAEVKAGKKFCASCGAKIGEVEEEKAQSYCDQGYEFLYSEDYRVRDPKKAFECFELAERNGEENATIWLGRCYYEGLGVEQDYNTAFKYFKKTNTPYWTGMCYFNGEGTRQDYHKAFELFQLADRENIESAYYYLGMCYYNGYGVPENMQMAFKYFKKGADAEDANNYWWLGLCYEAASGCSENPNLAFKYYKLAHEAGACLGHLSLGECYVNGYGCSIDRMMGLHLLLQAVNCDIESAQKFIEENFNYAEKWEYKYYYLPEVIRNLIAKELDIDITDVNNQINFINDLGVHPLDIAGLILKFEEEFCVAIPEDEYDDINTVGDCIRCVQKLISI